MTTERAEIGIRHVSIGEPNAAALAPARRAFDQKAALPPRPKTSFERIKLGQNNFIDATGETRRRLAAAAKRATKTATKDRHSAAAQLEEPQYSMEVHFSSDNDAQVKADRTVSYTEPLVNPGTNADNTVKTATERTYQVRVRLTQHHAGELFQGVKLEWNIPTGWVWTDGMGDTTYHEFVSNPLVILRIARYESGDKGWRVIVAEWYR